MKDVVIAGLAIAVLWVLGALSLRIARFRDLGDPLPMRLAVDLGIGAGVLMTMLLLSFALTGRLHHEPVYLFLLALGLGNLFQRPHPSRRPEALHRPTPLEALLLGVLFTLSAAVAFSGAFGSLEGDGLTQWGFKAKAFYLDQRIDGPFLQDGDRYSSFADYPPLLPLSEYWVYAHLGHVNDQVVRLVPVAFFFALLAFFYGSLLGKVPRSSALLVTLFLSFNAPILIYTLMGYADGVQAFFHLAGLVSLLRWREGGGRKVLILAAGLLGMGAAVKNEGLSFLFLVSIVLVVSRFSEGRKPLQALAIFHAVAFAFYGPWMMEKMALGVSSDLFIGPPPLVALGDRFRAIVAFYGSELFGRGAVEGWGLLWPLIAIGLIRTFVLRRGPGSRYRIAWLACFLQLALFVMVYLITPYDLAWHLTTSVDRTLLQLAPAFLWLTTIALFPQRTPGAENVIMGGPTSPPPVL